MKVEFLSSFAKDIDSINQKSDKLKLLKVIAQFERAITLSEIPQIKKLSGHKSAYRIRIGDYRLGFFYESEKIIIARFVHRKEIYKIFP
jgi:mRNA interferase RelE/StbE